MRNARRSGDDAKTGAPENYGSLSVESLRQIAVVHNFGLTAMRIYLDDLGLTDEEFRRVTSHVTSDGPIKLMTMTWVKVNLLELVPEIAPLKKFVNSINGHGVHSPLKNRLVVNTPWGHVTHANLASALEADIDGYASQLNQFKRDYHDLLQGSSISNDHVRKIADKFVTQLRVGSKRREQSIRESVRKGVYPIARRRFPALQHLQIRAFSGPVGIASKTIEEPVLRIELLLSVSEQLAEAIADLAEKAIQTSDWAPKRPQWRQRLDEITLFADSCGLALLSPFVGRAREVCLGRRTRPNEDDVARLESLRQAIEIAREKILAASLSRTEERVAVLTRMSELD